MKNYSIIPYAGNDYYDTSKDFERALHSIELVYSLQNLANTENISPENSEEALIKAIDICHLDGIDEYHHFQKIYICDAVLKTIILDWRMSKNGLNLVVMQLPLVNEEKENWLWKAFGIQE